MGTFRYGKAHNSVVPIDEKIQQEIVIPRGMEYPEAATPAQKAAKHRVIGKEARQSSQWDDLDGVVVEVEVNDAPTLSLVSTLSGGVEDNPLTISYADLAAAADEADVDGDAL